MSYEDPEQHGLFGVSNAIYNSRQQYGDPRRNASNIDDDEIWGKSWSAERLRLKQLITDRNHKEIEIFENELRREAAAAARERASIESGSTHAFDWQVSQAGGRTYHVSPDGVSRPCTATVSCPFGAADHFTVRDEQLQQLQGQGLGLQDARDLIGSWVKERQQFNELKEVDRVHAVPGSTIRQQLNGTRSKRDGSTLKTVTAEVTLDFDSRTGAPIKIARKIGNLKSTPWKDHAYWAVDLGRGEEEVVRTDHITEGHFDEWATQYINANWHNITPAEEEEFRAEFRYQLQKTFNQVESMAAKTDRHSVHYSVVPLEYRERQTSKVNYASDPWTPDRLIDNSGSFPSTTSLYEGFEIYEEGGAEGLAGWKARKGKNGWAFEVTGSRGDVHLFETSDPQEAADFMDKTLGDSWANENYKRQREAAGLDGTAGYDLNVGPKRSARAEFVKELLTTDQDTYRPLDDNGQESLF